ncbi:thiol reductant ABC exporter subunit CydD [Streptomyces sp. ACA25]|uniref:thiol reductant ABC exporter subunit CydD n=1 Tax=Streptomyces sp. ACA25 TaxID=3022596 RepID=UPI00230727C2|nr:thiol reductant ABC exporter subunit CydD [Streptomyces sp. ACA25]MDB1086205.1 thiol reductant ABC exporter subunit CydD [Streptomyces sp. ACA25]
MKPVDPRLLRHARATRGFLAASVTLGLAGAVLIIAQAVLLADLVVGAFQQGADAGDLTGPLLWLAATAAGRALISWLTELAAHRASASVKSELRTRLLTHATRLTPHRASHLTDLRTGELTTLATRGVDALDGYFARYLPQLGLAVVVPVAVLAKILTEDWISALTIIVTLPLIPVFMILIGWATQAHMDRQWKQLSRLSGHFLDVVAGLPTLKVFGRAKAQADNIRAITSDYRRSTLRTLRLAFLSSFALELLATISVALVAVGIGMRLVHGELDLHTGLVVLILAPEAYLPLRQVGAQYHAAAEGLSAADEVFTVLETEPPARGTHPAPDARSAPLVLDRLVVRHAGRDTDSLPETTLTIRPGETVALTGPSGAGKTTLLNALLGFAEPTSGRILLGGRELAEIDPASWHAQIAWVPQHPQLFAGTIADNVRLARPDADDAAVAAALRDAAAGDLDPGRQLGEAGAGLSAGQRQRVALARAVLADRPVLLLDEPTAALDSTTEAAVLASLQRLAADRTVILITHRPALLPLTTTTHQLSLPATPRAAAAPPPARAGDPGPGAEAPGQGGGGETPSSSLPPGPTPTTTLNRRPGTRLALAAALGTAAVLSTIGLMAVSGWLISRASEQPPILYLMVAVTLTRAFGIGRAVFRYAERLVSHDAVLRILADLRVTAYRRLERLAPAGLRGARRGDLLSRVVTDVDALQDHFLRWLLPATVAGCASVAAVAFTGRLLPAAGAALAAGLLAAGIGVPALTGAVARRTERQLAPARGALATRTVDLLTGTPELTVAGALPARLREVRAADAALTGIAARSAAATALGSGLTVLAAGLTVTAAAWSGVGAVHDGRLDGVWLATVVLLSVAAFEAVAGLPLAVQYRQRTRRAAERVQEVLDAPDPVREPELPAPAPPSPLPLRVRGLTARHAGQPEPALRGIDLDLTAGRRVAVVGPSGSGKTTLAHCLLRFLDPEAGTYTLGGTPATALDGDTVRRAVGLCAQDAHLFDSSLRENLRLARTSATDGQLHAALAAARLTAWVDSLPEGLDTPVGEHGARLSGGQRQRLALARALLADFPVLVLDEPAEHLDLATADALTADLLAVTEGRTTVLITHRLAGLEAVDEVLVLDGGRPVQQGSYQELAAAEGPFRGMLEREAAGFVPAP